MSQSAMNMASGAANQTREGLAEAASAPLDDFNLRRREIPQLLAGMTSPYGPPTEMNCAGIAMDVAELDAVLGRDWDSGAPDERLNSEVLADEAANAALDTVRSVSTGWIPFRGLVRQATGAQSHEKKYNQAFRIGAQRRTYLKGYGQALGCPTPAQPDFEALERLKKENKVQYR
ncbi:MAG: hypothetical protein ACK4Y9_10770 [Hyphomonas sp.]